jgi:hypothetical protein
MSDAAPSILVPKAILIQILVRTVILTACGFGLH